MKNEKTPQLHDLIYDHARDTWFRREAERLMSHWQLDGYEYVECQNGKLVPITTPEKKDMHFWDRNIERIPSAGLMRLILASFERGAVYVFETKGTGR